MFGVRIFFSNSGPIAGLRFNVSVPPAHMATLRNERTNNHLLVAGVTNIAGNSDYKVTFTDKLTQQEADAIISGTEKLTGMFEYCDALGNYTCNQFDLRYRDAVFVLDSVLPCNYAYPRLIITSDQTGQLNKGDILEYMKPCPTVAEQRRSEQEEREAIERRPRPFKIK